MIFRIGLIIMIMFGASQVSAGVVDSPKRVTFAQYAKKKRTTLDKVTKRFAATVVIRCSGHQATAQFTGSMEYLTTSDHVFFDRENCKPTARVEDCEITVRTALRQVRFNGFEMADHGYREKLEEIEREGGACPVDGFHWADDWAILRFTNREAIASLKKEVEPYKVPGVNDVRFENEGVIAIAGAALDFMEYTAQGMKFYPRNIQECRVRDLAPSNGQNFYVETDCDTAELTSGGSLLRPGKGSDTLIGIHMGNFETREDLLKALAEKRFNTNPYRKGQWSALYVSLDGAFLRSLQRLLHISADLR
jgi:hypothetical protein